MNCQCFIKTKVCHVLKVLRRVGGAEWEHVCACVCGRGWREPIMSLADPVTFLKRFFIFIQEEMMSHYF